MVSRSMPRSVSGLMDVIMSLPTRVQSVMPKSNRGLRSSRRELSMMCTLPVISVMPSSIGLMSLIEAERTKSYLSPPTLQL